MKCQNCGTENPKDSKFCIKCGTEIADNGCLCPFCGGVNEEGAKFCTFCGKNVGKRKTENIGKKGIIAAGISTMVILVIAAGVIFFLKPQEDENIELVKDQKTSNFDTSTNLKEEDSSVEEKDDQQNSMDMTILDEENKENQEVETLETETNAQFSIDSDTEEDYSIVLDPAKYLVYDSGISDFSFAYPSELFNTVELETSAYENEYGTNMETIYFTGSEGSELEFSMARRKDALTVEEMKDKICAFEKRNISDMQEILNAMNGNYGKLVLTGWEDSEHDKTIYHMIKVEQDYILQMKVSIPVSQGKEDEFRKGYVTECLYRMCGFSDSDDTWRSYTEYKEAANG